MKKNIIPRGLICLLLLNSCHHISNNHTAAAQTPSYAPGEFGYDLEFLQKQDPALVVLKKGDAQVIVSPGYQGKVFTSTSDGEKGQSFGWINYKIFGKSADSHMNAYGGENRLWLGPEGGKFSLFFPPKSKMIFENWKTPAGIDTEAWDLKTRDSNRVTLQKEMALINYQADTLRLKIDRSITILGEGEIISSTGIPANPLVKSVGYETENLLTNQGSQEWTAATGMPCIWILDMFKPSSATIIIVPFRYSPGQEFVKAATTSYFGEIPASRIGHNDSLLVFKADGKNRGKLGIVANKAKNIAGSYDALHKVLTIILFEVDARARYLNQEWNTTKPSFSGDAVNAYNDGPLADGTQMGPFYEIESVSPAAFLKPNETLSHKHSVFHFTGNEQALNEISLKLLGISLKKINAVFSGSSTD
jgi:hypothetical protein